MNKWTDFMFSENSPDTISQLCTRFSFLPAYFQKRFEVTYNKKGKKVAQAIEEEM